MEIDLSTPRAKVGIAIAAVLVLGLFYFLWTKSASPEPTLPPGQSISNPAGNKDNGPRNRNG